MTVDGVSYKGSCTSAQPEDKLQKFYVAPKITDKMFNKKDLIFLFFLHVPKIYVRFSIKFIYTTTKRLRNKQVVTPVTA